MITDKYYIAVFHDEKSNTIYAIKATDEQEAHKLLELQLQLHIQKERGNDYSGESQTINYKIKEITESVTRIC